MMKNITKSLLTVLLLFVVGFVYGQKVFVFNFNESNHATSANGVQDGDITQDEVLTINGITLTASAAVEGVNTPNRYWGTNNGPQLRMYSGTLTIEAPSDNSITNVSIDYAKWNEGNTFNETASSDGTWSGDASKVELVIAGNTQINKVTVTLATAIEDPLLPPAKEKLSEAITFAKTIGMAELADAITAAETALNAEDATVASITAAQAALVNAVKENAKPALQNAIAAAGMISADTGALNDAIAAATAVLNNNDATPEELLAALQTLYQEARTYATTTLASAIAAAKKVYAASKNNSFNLKIKSAESKLRNADSTLQDLYQAGLTLKAAVDSFLNGKLNEDEAEKEAPEGWTKLISNGNLAGDNTSNFITKEASNGLVVNSTVIPLAGKDNSRGILVQSSERTKTGEKDDQGNDKWTGEDWDTQFWIKLNEALPAKTKLHVEFDYKASKSAKANTQAHGNPGNYSHWACIGDVDFTTEWQHFSTDIEVTSDMTQKDGGLLSIAFNLAVEKTATDYYFDNFGVWYQLPEPEKVIVNWANIIVNSDMEGESTECFYVTEQAIGGPYLAQFTEGIGKDGSKAVKVQSGDNPSQDWDSQFFIRLPYKLPAGTKYKVSFDYKANKAGDFDTQSHAEPGGYIFYTMIGSGSFSTDWQTFNATGEIGEVSSQQSPSGNMQTIAFNLAKNKVATEFIFDNVKFEVDADIVKDLVKNPATNPVPYPADLAEVMAEAIALVAEGGVAVDKLSKAMATGRETRDASVVQAAIDQFKADNADLEKDETAKVGTAPANWSGATNSYGGKKVITATGAEVSPIEAFGDNACKEGYTIKQEVEVENGTYAVELYATSHNAWGGQYGGVATLTEDATDVAHVFATGDETFTAAITSRKDSGMSNEEPQVFTFDNITVSNGKLTIGLVVDKSDMCEWQTIQIKSLRWIATAKDVYAVDQEELAALVAEAEALVADENKTEGKDEFEAALETPKKAIGEMVNWYNIPEIEEIIANLKTAISNFRKANYFIDLTAGEYYIIDTESGLKMGAGHSWGTQGLVNDLGLDLILTPDEESRSVTIDSRIFNGSSKHFLGNNLYMDSPSYGWFLDYQGFGFYITDGEQYINLDANNNLVMSDTPREWIIVTAEGVKAQLLEEMANATEENPVDATLFIKGNNFSRFDSRNDAWAVEQAVTGEGHTTNPSGGNNENNCAEAYHTGFSFIQTISDAPAGLYGLIAQGFYRQDDYEGETPAAPMFFANEASSEIPARTGSENSMSDASASFTNGLYTIEPIKFELKEGDKMDIGVRGTSDTQWVIFDNFQLVYYGPATMEGDANLNNEVTTADAVLAVSFALEIETPTERQFKAADVNKSNDITVSDAVGIVNIALEKEPDAQGGDGARMVTRDFLTWNGQEIGLENGMRYVAFQMDVTLADGSLLNGVQLAGRANDLQLIYNKVGDNTWRIAAFSLNNTFISGNAGSLLKLDITGNSDAVISNVEFTDEAARAYNLGFNSEATGISRMAIDANNAEVFTLSGTKSSKAVKGVNVIRNNGRIQKVLVK